MARYLAACHEYRTQNQRLLRVHCDVSSRTQAMLRRYRHAPPPDLRMPPDDIAARSVGPRQFRHRRHCAASGAGAMAARLSSFPSISDRSFIPGAPHAPQGQPVCQTDPPHQRSRICHPGAPRPPVPARNPCPGGVEPVHAARWRVGSDPEDPTRRNLSITAD